MPVYRQKKCSTPKVPDSIEGQSCAGSLGVPFSNVTLSCDEPHDQDAVLFHGRPKNHLQLFAEFASSQAHVATPSAILKCLYHLRGILILASAAGLVEVRFPEVSSSSASCCWNF